jgi:hypothetical protein
MATTYIDLVNIALREINEVPLSTSAFNNPRGLQAAAKEMVARAHLDIINYSKEWPFLSADGDFFPTGVLSVATTALQGTYLFDTDLSQVDWDSFFIVSDTGTYARSLETIDVDFYTKYLKHKDEGDTQGGDPIFVYRTKSGDSTIDANPGGFGLHPIPSDKGYTVTFAGWEDPHASFKVLETSADTIPYPEKYYPVLIARARYYLWLFRENAQQSQIALGDYQDGIKRMHRDLVDKQSIKMRAV